jgi:hypothetical protein
VVIDQEDEVSHMPSLNESLLEYQEQLQKGMIQKAYKGLMDFMQGLRSVIQKEHPDLKVSGALYFGYMDMTYFAVIPDSLKDRHLKIAVVFLHKEYRFEVWLSAANRDIGKEIWQLFSQSSWHEFHLVPSPERSDSIVEYVVTDQPDFDHPEELTRQIISAVEYFITGIETFFTNK